jgi:hypothetical protein
VIVEQLQILQNPWDISREHTWNLKSVREYREMKMSWDIVNR